MLFSLTPKNKKEELFDREEELEQLKSAIRIYPMVIITGLRRVGKSSLIRVFLNENKFPYVLLDGRVIYERSAGNITRSALVHMLKDEFSKFSRFQKIFSLLKRIKGISIAGNSVEINPSEFDLLTTLERLNGFASKEKTYFVLFFDEAQYLKSYGSRGGKDILALLAYVYDNFENVRMIITGSEVGVLHDFLKFDDYDSPLYGRSVYTLSVKPFNFEKSVEFIKRGLEEVGKELNFVPEEVVRKIDGIPGYLVLFGVKYLETRNAEKALEEVYQTMRVLFEKELAELERRSKRYTMILEFISSGINTWKLLKRYLFARNDPISDSRLYTLLKNLEKMNLIEKTPQGYKIIDPILEEILRR